MNQSDDSLIHDYHLLSYDVLDSTNDEAKRLAGGGATHGAVIWARAQTNGKGRLGRHWESLDGNLFTSILLSPDCDMPSCAQLSFAAALAVADTLKPIVSDEYKIQCKWPNDVLLNGKKLCGVLLESFTTLEEDGSDRQWVVVGVGVNIDSYPEETLFPATCLKESGVEIISAKIVLSRFVYNFIHRYDAWIANGFEALKDDWTEAAYGINEPIEAHVGKDIIKGRFDSIDAFGRLLIEDSSGAMQSVSAGDVFFRKEG